MKKILLIVGLMAGTVLSALAGDIDIYDSHGHWVGWAERNGCDYNVYDTHSGYQGFLQRNGDQFNVFDTHGGYRGWVDQNGYIWPNH